MVPAQLTVPGDSPVRHAAVEARPNLEFSGPVERHDLLHDPGQLRLSHMDDPTRRHAGLAALGVANGERAQQDTVAKIELLAVVEQLGFPFAEPCSALGTERQREPIREVDEVLVHHVATCNVARQPVVPPGDVGARVVNLVSARLLGRTTRSKTAVPQGAENLAEGLLSRIEPFVDELPAVVHSPPPCMLSSRSKNA